MAWWSISLFLISVTYLTYQHPPATWTALPQWLRPAKRRVVRPGEEADVVEERKRRVVNGDRKEMGSNEEKRVTGREDQEKKETVNKEKGELVIKENPAATTHAPNLVAIQDEAGDDDNQEEEKTPQAKPTTTTTTTTPADVPSFNLDDSHTVADNQQNQETPSFDLDDSHTTRDDDNEEEEEEDERDNLPPPMFPAMNSAQRANKPPPSSSSTAVMGPPSVPSSSTNSTPSTASSMMPPPPKPSANPGMMPPPVRPASSLMPPPRGPPPRSLQQPQSSRPSTLGVPSKGPVPNRGGGLAPPPSAASQARGGLAPSRIDTPNSRNKVQLTPGHSPLDWATLSRSKNLSGVPSFMRVTPSMLKHFNGRKDKATGEKKDAWSVFHGKVYNISPYLKFHPGGEGELLRGAGKDGTKMFLEVHPWVNWEGMMGGCLVGVMVGEEEEGEGLEGLD